MLAVYFLSFLSFGLFIAIKAQQKNLFPKEFLYIASLTFSLAFSYFLFYMYAFSYGLGHKLLLAFLATGLVFLGLSVREVLRDKKALQIVRTFFVIPLLIVAGFLVIYTHLFYVCPGAGPVTDQWGEIQNPAFCHVAELPIDNALPFIYAQNVLNDNARSLVIDWNITDRPPLQIGTSLPIVDISRDSNQFTKYAYYNIFSIFLQLSWVGLLWGVLTTIFKRRWRIAGLLIGLGATGFFYLNSVFVWPKLLAASLTVFGILLLIESGKKHKNLFDYRYAVVAALAISLGLLSHTGVIFTVLGLVPLLIYDLLFHKAARPNLVPLLIAALIGLTLLVPWQIAKSQLTTHDRLVKWQLAGVISSEDNRGTLKTIKQEYGKLSFEQWLGNKRANVETIYTGLVGHKDCGSGLKKLFGKCNMANWRSLTFFSPFFAFEFFAFGFLIIIWQLFRRSLEKIDKTLLWIIFLSLVVWVLLLFIPGSTVLHQGSYATELLLFLLLGKKLAVLPPYVFAPLVGSQVVLFYLAWLRPFGISIL